MRTIVDSVQTVNEPPKNIEELERSLRVLEERFAGAIFKRYLEHLPSVAEDAYVAPGAVLIGQVTLGPKSSVWPGVVLRADINRIDLGEGSNIQDGSVVHLGDTDPTWVGNDVVVGHRVVLHGCRVEDACLIGIQSTVLDAAVIGEGSVIGAGALVTAETIIPPRSLVLGVPGKVVKKLSGEDERFHRQLAAKYMRLAHNHRLG
ncbi:MAG: gamma carbonic anhydrase family protein [Myxococcales bacterium]|nr:MAG: gamma carbonic anhydrase family protein [Myxococcales bacterium]